jgi:uncharacterized membrane protein
MTFVPAVAGVIPVSRVIRVVAMTFVPGMVARVVFMTRLVGFVCRSRVLDAVSMLVLVVLGRRPMVSLMVAHTLPSDLRS